MASLALDETYFPLEIAPASFHPTSSMWGRQVTQTHTRTLREPLVIELGLKSGAKIKWVPDGPFPHVLAERISKLLEFESLSKGWDSYGALPHKADSQATVLALLLHGHQRASLPDLVPLKNGGVGLRWRAQDRELEIDVNPDGQSEIFLVDETTGVECETDEPVDVAEAEGWLVKFWQRG